MLGVKKLDTLEKNTLEGGLAITLSAVMAVLAISIVAVVCYRFLVSPKGKVDLPGGFKFEWGNK